MLAAERARSLEFQKGNGNEITGKLKGLWELGGGKGKEVCLVARIGILGAKLYRKREREGKLKNIDLG